MLIKPERMLRFKVIVPEEYEYDLLDSLISLGAIHLKPLAHGSRIRLPLLLQLIVENRIPPERIDIKEAYKIIVRTTYRDDILRLEIEKIYEEYNRINYYRELVKRLLDINLSPLIFRKTFKKLIFKWYYADRKFLRILISELRKNRAIVKTIFLSSGETIIVVIYSRELDEKISSIIKKFDLKEVVLPDWMYTSSDFIFSSIDRRIRELRRKAYDLLSELATLLTSSFEYEQASRVQLLELALNACENIYMHIPSAEEMLEEAIVIRITRKILEEKKLEILERIGIDKKMLNIYRKLLDSSEIDEKFVEELMKKEYCKIYPTVCNDILEEVENVEKLKALKKVIEIYLKRFSSPTFLRKRIGDIELSVFVGEKKYTEALREEILRIRAAIEILDISASEAAVLVAHKAVNREDVESVMERYGMKRVEIPSYVLENIESAIERIDQELNEKIDKIKLLLLFLMIDYYVKKKRIMIDDQLYIRLVSELENLRMRRLEARMIPSDRRFETIKGMVDDTERILNALKENYNILQNIGKEPNIEKIYLDEEHMLKIIEEFVNLGKNVLCLQIFLESLLNAQSRIQGLTLLHNRRVFIADGWIPEKYAGYLEKTLVSRIPRIIYFRIRDVVIGEEVPTLLRKRGVLRHFIPLTLLRGVPNYWELDPTPIFTFFFLVMYGLMFGDVGLGVIISIFGLWLYKTKKRILGISEEGVESLSVLSIFAGISSIIFGVLYGIVFLADILPTGVLKPIHDPYTIIGIALLFGVIQLITGMIINIINDINEKNYMHAIFGGTGLAGLVYYTSGVYLAYLIIYSGYNLGILASEKALPFIIIIACALLLVFLSAFFRYLDSRETDDLVDGFIELLEMIITYPANSLSYIRLAAFAIAHEVFGILAAELSLALNPLVSYFITNILVLSVEALAVGIQALRLTYYEFSTKFFRGGGLEFTPVSTSEMVLTQK